MTDEHERCQTDNDAAQSTVIVNLNFGNRTIQLRPFDGVLLLAALGGLVLFIRLGLWQLDRAGEKRAILAQYAAGQQTTERLLPGRFNDLPRYQQISVRGHYDGVHQILLDNMPSAQGQPGYRVLTPFQSDGGEWLLVDRGWLPLGTSRAVLPNVEVADNVRTITGRIDELPQPGMRLREASRNVPSRWPHVVSFPRHEEIATALGRAVPARRILLDKDQDDGFERTPALRVDFGPDRHVAYAVQWFALAAAVVGMFIVVMIKAPRLRP